MPCLMGVHQVLHALMLLLHKHTVLANGWLRDPEKLVMLLTA